MGNLTQAKEIIGIPNSTLVKTALNATGTAPIYACRAWVNFNGTGTVAIRASGNVSSIADYGVGIYEVNFTTAMPNADFSANTAIGKVDGSIGTYYPIVRADQPSASGFVIRVLVGQTLIDAELAYASVFK